MFGEVRLLKNPASPIIRHATKRRLNLSSRHPGHSFNISIGHYFTHIFIINLLNKTYLGLYRSDNLPNPLSRSSSRLEG